MKDRSRLISEIRAEIVGPARPAKPEIIEFEGDSFSDPIPKRRGALAWEPDAEREAQEILYWGRETPHRKYGAGVLHPSPNMLAAVPDQQALEATDTVGVESEPSDADSVEEEENLYISEDSDAAAADSEFEITSPTVRKPSSMGMSVCAEMPSGSRLVVRLPDSRHYSWQPEGDLPTPLNGYYEGCKRTWKDDDGKQGEAAMWRRRPVLPAGGIEITFATEELQSGRRISKKVPLPKGTPVGLMVDVFPRRLSGDAGHRLLTVVLRNTSGNDVPESVLYQSFFEVRADAGHLRKYPESERPFEQLDSDEQTLALLYREVATWGIGHGCSAGWDCDPGQEPQTVFAEAMPAVQLPSMTPNIKDAAGNDIHLSMRALAELTDDGTGEGWEGLKQLADEYAAWIARQRYVVSSLPTKLQTVAERHLDSCEVCLRRIRAGTQLLADSSTVRRAFRLANLAMLLQQIATKQIEVRPLHWDSVRAAPQGSHDSPWRIYESKREDRERVGTWRAFQAAFLLMSLDGVCSDRSVDRETVDLIWFPTGGGKTEAYLAVMATYIFHERLREDGNSDGIRRDGTNAIMRYTLRMLTTQQFQRAASLICAMEYLRRQSLEGQKPVQPTGDLDGYTPYAPIVALAVSLHGPVSPRVDSQRSM